MLQLQLGIELVFSLVVSLKCCGCLLFFSLDLFMLLHPTKLQNNIHQEKKVAA